MRNLHLFLLCPMLGVAAQLPAVSEIVLTTTTGHAVRFAVGDAVTAVVFISARCPLSQQYLNRLDELSGRFSGPAARVLIVDSNVNETPDEIQALRRTWAMESPIYRDVGAKLAGAVSAQLTPLAIVFDRQGKVRYRGSIDDARLPSRVQRTWLADAISAVAEGRQPSPDVTAATGCTIKRPRPGGNPAEPPR